MSAPQVVAMPAFFAWEGGLSDLSDPQIVVMLVFFAWEGGLSDLSAPQVVAMPVFFAWEGGRRRVKCFMRFAEVIGKGMAAVCPE